ncbi:MAG: serine/threonine protein kinase, partial [Myxococcales bacterium]|nr:serine/threonine protein kinase [Myxococcales bacterium]
MAHQSGTAKKKDAFIGRVVAGRYRLEELLGEGGMGVVYRARHVLIDRVVAIKLIRPDLRSETHLRAWMLREARAANRVDHAHIVD